MNLNKASLIACALPLALSVACGDDTSSDDGTSPTTTSSMTDMSTSMATPPTTMDPADGSTTTPSDPSDTDPDPDSSSGEPAGTGAVSVIHLGVDAPEVDVFANSMEPAAVMALAYRAGTGYLDLPAAEYAFQVNAAGAGPANPVLEATLTVEEGMNYTAAAIGVLGGDPALQILPLVDNLEGIDGSSVRVTVIHAAPAPALAEVDIWNVTDPAAPMMLLENVPFAGFGTLPDLPAEGEVVVGIDADDDMMPEATFTVPLGMAGGAHVNVFASSDAAGGDVALMVHVAALGLVLPVMPD